MLTTKHVTTFVTKGATVVHSRAEETRSSMDRAATETDETVAGATGSDVPSTDSETMDAASSDRSEQPGEGSQGGGATDGQGGAEGAEGAESVDVDALSPDEIRELLAGRERDAQEIARLQDARLRLQAEFDNYRRRTRQEMDDVRKSAAADLVLQLLPVVDNLERAVAVSSQDARAAGYTQGVELIIRQFLSVLQSAGVEPIPAVGEAFDPQLHEAVATEASDEYPAGVITEEVRRGYTIGGKVLRAGLVKVSAGPVAKEEKADE